MTTSVLQSVPTVASDNDEFERRIEHVSEGRGLARARVRALIIKLRASDWVAARIPRGTAEPTEAMAQVEIARKELMEQEHDLLEGLEALHSLQEELAAERAGVARQIQDLARLRGAFEEERRQWTASRRSEEVALKEERERVAARSAELASDRPGLDNPLAEPAAGSSPADLGVTAGRKWSKRGVSIQTSEPWLFAGHGPAPSPELSPVERNQTEPSSEIPSTDRAIDEASDEESIDEYMSRLLVRMRTITTESPIEVEVPSTAVAGAPDRPTAPASRQEQDPRQPLPRRSPTPDGMASVAAMRQLAQQTALVALDHHKLIKISGRRAAMIVLALGGLLIAGLFGIWGVVSPGRFPGILFSLAAMGLVISAIGTLRYVWHTVVAWRLGRSVHRRQREASHVEPGKKGGIELPNVPGDCAAQQN